MTLLDRLQSPADLRTMTAAERTQLAQEIRDFLISTCSVTGGHIGAGLGVVELLSLIHI
jgi:1-deoxy-D-xylulose-5-phosphate synthase